VSVVERVAPGPLADAIAREARGGAIPFVIELDAAAQKMSGQAVQPTYLLASEEEGGFARQGFWLQEAGREPTWHKDPYVNLVVDPGSVGDGSFEEIFSHEIGHVFLRRLLPHLPLGYSRSRHGSLQITDYPTAFDEGFATHFQALARKLTHNKRLQAQDAGLEFKPFLPYWRDHMDRSFRVRGVRDNLFIQRQLPWPAGSVAENPDATSLFDPAQLKNGQQMMASEGVIATLFYRFLVAGPEDGLATRYADLFQALKALDATKLDSGTPFVLELARQHAKLFPKANPSWVRTIIETTYGATADASFARSTEQLALVGRTGDGDAFVPALSAQREALATLVEATEREPQKLSAALGPELWVARAGQASDAAHDSPPDAIVPVNLNTAEHDGLRSLGLGPDLTKRALENRTSRGPFVNLDDFAKRCAVPPEVKGRLAAGAAAVVTAGPYPRE
jgi:DNA uptake protein ComE-like DNA-binding protein